MCSVCMLLGLLMDMNIHVSLQTIHAQARSHSGELLSEAQLNMTVQVPVSMALDVRGGQLAVGREITIFPHGLGVGILSS